MIDLSNPEAMIAEARRRRERLAKGLPLHETPEEVAELKAKRAVEDDDRLEKEIQRDVYRLYRSFNCDVYWMSQARETRQTAGVPDLIVFNQRVGAAWYHEVKTPTGMQSPAQRVFQEQCERCGKTYVLGGVAAAEAQLVKVRVMSGFTTG